MELYISTSGAAFVAIATDISNAVHPSTVGACRSACNFCKAPFFMMFFININQDGRSLHLHSALHLGRSTKMQSQRLAKLQSQRLAKLQSRSMLRRLDSNIGRGVFFHGPHNQLLLYRWPDLMTMISTTCNEEVHSNSNHCQNGIHKVVVV